MDRTYALDLARGACRWFAASAAVAVVALPVVAEQAVEEVSFDDSLGTLPVRVSLCHQGRSTLSTGVLGDIHYDRTGSLGLGVRARVTGPPLAGGTLASYVDPRFVRANLQFIDNPGAAVSSYGEEFATRIRDRVLLVSASVGLAGGLVVVVLLRSGRPGADRRRRLTLAALALGTLVASSGAAALLFDRWPCNRDPRPGYASATVPDLTFSSPQTLELARQVRPFLEKNAGRTSEQTEDYLAAADSSFAGALARRAAELTPREGEVVVVAESDPQGSRVGTRLRTALLARLTATLGEDVVALRTISGDVTSNGTVAEDGFVEDEAAAGGDLPVAAVAGDHDSEITEEQMVEHGMVVPDLGTEEVAGLRVSVANDVERKALFGALVSNDSGITEEELGARLREEVDPDEAGIVLLHQPDAATGYLGVDVDVVRGLTGSLTVPYDDGVPDVPPGTVSIGHLHDLDGPWVLWNTDGDEVTWTVVDQLGTSGGVEERPTFNRFSTPTSLPLKDLSVRLQYVDAESGLQTGWATVVCDPAGRCQVSGRTDAGLPITR